MATSLGEKKSEFKPHLKWPCVTSCVGNIVKVKLATVVEGDPKAPFSIATTPRCRRGCYSFPWIAPLYTWYVHYNTQY